MKQHITICVDEEIVKALKQEDNKSALVNGLLKMHFKTAEKKTAPELRKRIAEIKIEKEFKAKLDEIKAKSLEEFK